MIDSPASGGAVISFAPLAVGARLADRITPRRAGGSPNPGWQADPPPATGGLVDGRLLRLQLLNTDQRPLQLAISCDHLPKRELICHDLDPGEQRTAEVPTLDGSYDIAVRGPHGFLRRLAGDTASTLAGIDASLEITGPPGATTLRLVLYNADGVTRAFRVSSRIGGSAAHRVPPDSAKQLLFQPLAHDDGWYDISTGLEGVTSWGRRFAGHLDVPRLHHTQSRR